MANFLTHPSLEAIQAFLIIGNVLSYNMNPGVAYIFLGLTMRMAFSIGLQADSQSFSPTEQYARSRIWWALAWQDSHFSVSYDRPTASALCCPEIPYRNCSTPGTRSYAESMFCIIKLTQQIIRERSLNPRSTMTWSTIQQYKDEVERVVSDGVPHLRERSLCKVTTQHLERLALKLHSCYITSELCRPSLKDHLPSSGAGDGSQSANATPIQSPAFATQSRRKSSHVSSQSPASSSSSDPNLAAQFRRDCIHNLEGTIEAYVELHSLSEFAARSWIGIQRAVSAAFLLGTLRETNQEPRIHNLLRSLEHVIAQRAFMDPAFDANAEIGLAGSPILRARRPSADKPSLAESPHWAKSMSKSLKALGKLNKALQQQPPVQGQQHLHQALAAANTFIPGFEKGYTGFGGQVNPMSVAGGLVMPAYAPVVSLKNEVVSPGGTVVKGMMTTPESTSSGDWNYNNMNERASDYIIPALWG